ncbi:MAG TPA: TonB C-terminal domain-containing protein [Desulfatiglandales bacterium]|nr:TonB C-terminal domain-containing protein [Desulfatiglandales bacterium]
MTATWFTGSAGFGEEKWVRMLALSFFLHMVVFSTVLFVPKNGARYPSLKDRVYQVELVGPPTRGALRGGRPGGAAVKGKKTTQILRTKTQRIAVKEKEKVPVLAKRVSPKLKEKPEQSTTSSSGLIEEALSKIERKVTEEKKVQPTPTPTETIENEEPAEESEIPSQGEGAGFPGTYSETGKVIALYQMEIESAVKNNWSYPVALLNAKTRKGPEAVVILTVRNDGKIMKHWFKERSHDPLFDDSVQKAIEKSDPLPPFPPGYKKSYDEVEINFSLKDLV